MLEIKPLNKRSKKQNSLLYLVIILLIALVVFFGFKYYESQIPTNITISQTGEVDSNKIIEDVSKIFLLPINEQPSVALIKDLNSLAPQPIFTNAQNGDVLLIYLNAKKAILYRPSENKVIDVGPVNVSSSQ